MEDQAAYITRARIEAKLSLVYVKPRSEVHVPEDPTRWDDRCGELVRLNIERMIDDATLYDERLLIAEFEKLVLKAFKVTTKQMILSKWRKREVVNARQLMMFILVKFFNKHPYVAAARFQKDRVTCLHAIKAVENLYETNQDYRETTKNVWKLWLTYNDKLPVVQQLHSPQSRIPKKR